MWDLCNQEEKKFIDELIGNNGNQTSAYMVAYPKASYESAQSGASRKLSSDKIKNALDERRAILNAMLGVGLEWRLNTLKTVAEDGLGVYVDKYGNERKEGLGSTISAVNEINKMLGGHAPTKVSETDSEGNDKPEGIRIEVVGVTKGKIAIDDNEK